MTIGLLTSTADVTTRSPSHGVRASRCNGPMVQHYSASRGRVSSVMALDLGFNIHLSITIHVPHTSSVGLNTFSSGESRVWT